MFKPDVFVFIPRNVGEVIYEQSL